MVSGLLHPGNAHYLGGSSGKMRCKVRKMPNFPQNWHKKAATVTDTIVSITVAVMVRTEGLEPPDPRLKRALLYQLSYVRVYFHLLLILSLKQV